MRKQLNTYRLRLKEALDEAGRLKNSNDALKEQLTETNSELMDVRIEIKSMKSANVHLGNKPESCHERERLDISLLQLIFYLEQLNKSKHTRMCLTTRT